VRSSSSRRLLILDEPTEGIQPNVVHEIGDVILALNRDTGVTVPLVEQQLRFARRVASDFCILEKGRHVAAGPIDALTDAVVRERLRV
jgi:urea transport system ATP-binding protein